jgi:hypothetical protein
MYVEEIKWRRRFWRKSRFANSSFSSGTATIEAGHMVPAPPFIVIEVTNKKLAGRDFLSLRGRNCSTWT